MAYWLDDGFDTWPEVIRAGSAAVGLYVRCGAWIARNPTDGYVPAEVAAMYGTPEWVTKLVAAGLWETADAGYRDVYYLVSRNGVKLNPTAARVLEQKAQKADRQRRWLENKKTGKTPERRVSSQSPDASRGALADLPPSLPPLKGDGVRPRKRGATPPNTHTPNCPYPDRDPDTCSICASERKAAPPPGNLVDQELPLPWPDPAETATQPPAPTPTAPPAAAPSAQASAKAGRTPTRRPRPPARSTTTAGPSQPHHPDPQPAASSPPAPPASPPSSPETDTPAASGDWPIVLVTQTDGRPPQPAELREDSPNRPTVVKVIYTASRTAAWVARHRITQPETTTTPPPYPAGIDPWHAVWIATRRRGITAHSTGISDRAGPTPGNTSCGRSMRTGHQIQASQARAKHDATWCRSCWPTPKERAA